MTPTTMQRDVLCVYGTRPEAVKLISVVEALRERGASVGVLATGQHGELIDGSLAARLRPDWRLGVASDGSLTRLFERLTPTLDAVLREAPPRIVVVQGDTASAWAAAWAAQRAGIPVAHVEAGVRSGDASDPWPEEQFRVSIDAISTWHFAPTLVALEQLRAEGLDGVLTGQTGIDALRESGVEPCSESAPPTLLVTLHRRELRLRPDAPALLRALAEALAEAPCDALWPVHPAMQALAGATRWPSNVQLSEPLGHHALLPVLADARGLLTDSGGLVEEAAALGVPTAVLRAVTDRPEAETAGIAERFAPTPTGVRLAVQTLAERCIPRRPSLAYGDGRAGARIAAWLVRSLQA